MHCIESAHSRTLDGNGPFDRIFGMCASEPAQAQTFHEPLKMMNSNSNYALLFIYNPIHSPSFLPQNALICMAYLKHAVFVNKFLFGIVVVGSMFISVKVKCFFSLFIHAECGQYTFAQNKNASKGKIIGISAQ